MEACRRAFGPADPLTLQASRQRIGNLMTMADRRAEALRLQEQTVSLMERLLGEDNPLTLVEKSYLSLFMVGEAKLAEAEALARTTSEKLEKVLGADRRQTVDAKLNLATILRAHGGRSQLEESLRLLRAGVTFYETYMGHGNATTNDVRRVQIEVLLVLDRPDEAETTMRSLLDSERRRFGPASLSALKSNARLARILIAQVKSLAEAEDLARTAAAVATSVLA